MELMKVMNLNLLASKAIMALVFCLFVCLPWFFSKPVLAQEILTSPPRLYQKDFQAVSVELTIDIVDQLAKVHLRQTIKNTGKRDLELEYLMPMPISGAISGFSLMANGKELSGDLYDKDQAFKIYQDMVSKLKDPALLEFAGLGLFRVKAFPVAAGKSATLDLTLDYLLPKVNGRVDLDFPLANSLTQGLVVSSQIVSVSIKGPKIGGVFSLLDGVNLT
ncbi:MAG: hypothetical protein LBE80_03735 [Deltaproteobacteria bacterium]|jgi:Ca-activated chloride channel family protein|nr:hypothetical protein [Deltaproteobacteria bacterium]